MDDIKVFDPGYSPVKSVYTAAPPRAYTPAYVKKPQGDYFAKSSAVTKSNVEKALDDWLCRYAPTAFLEKYANEENIEKAVATNPNIINTLNSKGLEPDICMENITGKNSEHFLTTYKMAKELGKGLNTEDYNSLLKAALLHDVGKALIPQEILNKPGKLTKEERDIVNIHAELGAEILKSNGFSPKITQTVRLHHTPYTDYQKINNEMAQILSVADVYSALKEKRPYKVVFSDEQTKQIMMNDDRLNPEIVSKIPFAAQSKPPAARTA